jgi:hypothetical protein
MKKILNSLITARSYSGDAPKVAEVACGAWRHFVDFPNDDDRLLLFTSFHFFSFSLFLCSWWRWNTIGRVRTRGHQVDGNWLLQQPSRLRTDWRTSTSGRVGHPGRRMCHTSRSQRRCRQRPQAGEIHKQKTNLWKCRLFIMKNDLPFMINKPTNPLRLSFLLLCSFFRPSLKC